jgi:glycine cleavage system protein P-like pyridoxal-binding family
VRLALPESAVFGQGRARHVVEPTESEDQAEIDRFCDAMIAIHAENQKIDSPHSPQLKKSAR